MQDSPTPHYRLANTKRPLLGTFLTENVYDSTGANFEYCDGKRVFVDPKATVLTDDTCDDERTGTFAMSSIFESGKAVTLFDSEYKQFGTISMQASQASTSSTFVAKVSVDQLPKGVLVDIDLAVNGLAYFAVDPDSLKFVESEDGFAAILSDPLSLLQLELK